MWRKLWNSNILPRHKWRLYQLGKSWLKELVRARKDKVFRGKDFNPLKVYRDVVLQSNEYHSRLTPRVDRINLTGSWQTLPTEWIKANVDCSLGPNSTVVAAVRRNSDGRVVLVATRLLNTREPLVAELEAVHCALRIS
ncbi:hypothetical protein L484_000486 [Morus notabilis]|uniref:Uncharacterized protein n=1 Tax=Morus notabilis TaxID=981085 RepID=W9SNL0_9ROSA|nr:hypothetical protein L484_000486 [Morus notabilis]